MAHCRTRVADILPSLCDGGVVVALGVLAAATSTDAVTAATRLLVALTLSQTSNLAGMKRLNMCVRTVGGAVCVRTLCTQCVPTECGHARGGQDLQTIFNTCMGFGQVNTCISTSHLIST